MQTDYQENSFQCLNHEPTGTLLGPRTDAISIHDSSTSAVITSREVDKTARAILDVFNARAFRREHPASLDRLFAHILVAVSRNAPVLFLMYWGKGNRNAIGEPEQRAMALLGALTERIQAVYPAGAHFTFLFTDNHAVLNGYSIEGVRDYQNSVKSLAQTQGMKLFPMSQFVELNLDSLTREAGNVHIDPALFPILLCMCSKHFKSSENYELGARMYYLQNQREKEIVGEISQITSFLLITGAASILCFPLRCPLGISGRPSEVLARSHGSWKSKRPRKTLILCRL